MEQNLQIPTMRISRTQDKCQILEEDFRIRMTQELESEVSLMCNLSKGVEEKGIEKGRQEGIRGMHSQCFHWLNRQRPG